MGQWYGGEGGGGEQEGEKKQQKKKHVDQTINHSRCLIIQGNAAFTDPPTHTHTRTHARTHAHTQCSSNSKSLFSDMISDDTGICIASTGLQSKMMCVGGGGSQAVSYTLVLRCSRRFRLKELTE